jgi:TRAP-type mannitol/chloroaromatic compound transport system permease large subunit
MAPALPPEERASVTPLMVTRMLLVNLVPPLFLIFGVLGSIWGGYATPTEASAIGAFVALILMVSIKSSTGGPLPRRFGPPPAPVAW